MKVLYINKSLDFLHHQLILLSRHTMHLFNTSIHSKLSNHSTKTYVVFPNSSKSYNSNNNNNNSNNNNDNNNDNKKNYNDNKNNNNNNKNFTIASLKESLDKRVKEIEEQAEQLYNKLFFDFQCNVTEAVKSGGWDGKDRLDDAYLQWSFPGSLLYAVTVITTIGESSFETPRCIFGRTVSGEVYFDCLMPFNYVKASLLACLSL